MPLPREPPDSLLRHHWGPSKMGVLVRCAGSFRDERVASLRLVTVRTGGLRVERADASQS